MGARSRFLILALMISLNSQADVMNLNEFMPTRLEDATPTDLHKVEAQLSSHFDNKDKDQSNFRVNGRYGMTDRLQLEGMMNNLKGGNQTNSGDLQLGGQYLINKTEKYLPEVAISPGVILPTGSGSRGIDSHVRFNITSTLIGSSNTPTTQAHINFDWGNNEKRKSDERRNRTLYVIGLSHRFSDSGSLIIDFFREEDTEKGEERNMFEIGSEYELGSNYYVGVGAGIGIGDESPAWHGVLALEKQI